MNTPLAAKLPSTLTVLNPAPAQDSDSITVTQATAAKYHLKSIADLKSVASQFVLGGPSEFKTRTDGVIGLKSIYGLTFKNFDPLDESGPITLSALTSGKVQAADVFTTTPQISSTLNAVDAKLTTSALLALDVKVIAHKEDYTTAARQWLQSVGLG
jgi:osmoprotectant transport system substrate-binding protein